MAKVVQSFHNATRISHTILLQKFFNNNLSDTISQRHIKNNKHVRTAMHKSVAKYEETLMAKFMCEFRSFRV